MNHDELLEQEVRTWTPEESPSEAVSVNGVALSARDINLESANYDGGSITDRQHQAAVALVIRELLRQRATELGLLAADADLDDATIDRLLDQEIDIPEPDERACRRYFEQNRARFRGEDRAELRHILLPAHPDDLDQRDQVRQQAEALIAQLQSEPKLFANLALQHSACPSREQGGALGWIGRGQTVPEFEGPVLRLPAGLAERPVESRYGWHVVDVLDRQEGAALPFEAIHDAIARYLVETARSRATSQYLQVLAGEAKIEGLDLASGTTPLVQ